MSSSGGTTLLPWRQQHLRPDSPHRPGMKGQVHTHQTGSGHMFSMLTPLETNQEASAPSGGRNMNYGLQRSHRFNTFYTTYCRCVGVNLLQQVAN